MDNFLTDVWRGLNSNPKYLQSKYFYDDNGDAIFKEIMECPEYYLTRCELGLFANRSNDIARNILSSLKDFDLVELGPGDATKSVYLLDALMKQEANFTYYPIDISANTIEHLKMKLPGALPGIKVQGLNGEYFEMLGALKKLSSKNKVVLFLGSNIGNIPLDDTVVFLKELRSYLLPGDLALIGFDLKKDPEIILAAYNDKAGITRRFNLNLLQRINDKLGADFDLSHFEHQPEYDAITGACKSYLVSISDQRVQIGAMGSVRFKEGERIFMEVSQKYTVEQTDTFAVSAGFSVAGHFFDSKHWFLDALWQCW